jgi:arginyl-tRNA synthetase
MNLRSELDRLMSEAFRAAGIPADVPVMIALPARAQFGDYQANGVMAAAKRMGTNPRQLAQKVVDAAGPILLGPEKLAGKVEVAGPGFINIHLCAEWLSSELTARLADGRLGVPAPASPQIVVVDYSAPNLAKEMHVGHLRSTIIGDALARVLDFVGHKVIRQNHVGDWGTQFGMLVAYLKDLLQQDPQGSRADTVLSDLEEFYRQAKARFDADPAFADAARDEVVQLQAKEPATYDMWHRFRAISLRHCKQVYERLGVLLKDADVRGESFYNDDLPKVVADLDAKGLLTESQGAQCVFLDEFKGKDGEPLPVIVQKTGGGYLYATTDLAGMRYRAGTLHADRILYVTDARQALHFQQVFAVARKAGFVGPDVSLEHVPFGTMMGADGRPFKTRTGDTVKLMDLLDEAQQRAMAFVSEKNPDLPEAQRQQIANAVGIGAVKYADLSQNRSSDYVFSWDKMLSLDGNTAPYMQYAYARVRSIFRKGQGDWLRSPDAVGTEVPVPRLAIADPAERALGLKLAQFPETVETVARDCLPSVLCSYLYDLAGAFMGFYESCPVLKAPDKAARASRLLLCELTARTIQAGLNLLGIDTIEQM